MFLELNFSLLIVLQFIEIWGFKNHQIIRVEELKHLDDWSTRQLPQTFLKTLIILYNFQSISKICTLKL